MKPYLYLFIIIIFSFKLDAQQDIHPPSGLIVMVNRLEVTKTKTIRQDKPVTVRMIDGHKIKGIYDFEDERIMIIGTERVKIDSIYSISGYIIRNSKDKAIGAGLTILSGFGSIYPLYLIIGGLGLGEGKALFVGSTLLFFDYLLANAGTNLLGIRPKKFYIMNWEITNDFKKNSIIPISHEVSSILNPN